VSPQAQIVTFAGVLLFTILLVFQQSGNDVEDIRDFLISRASQAQKSFMRDSIRNSTLGFEKIFVIGLKERSDKRDALALMASVTGVKLEWIEGVKGADVPDKALPLGWDREKMSDSNLGSWRGHMEAIKRIVDEDLSSALIMEDDMDWDIAIKNQLYQFALGSHEIQAGLTPEPRPDDQCRDSPYGSHWDLLWLGSCSSTFPEDLPKNLAVPKPDSRKYLIKDDRTVAPEEHIKGNHAFSWEDYPPRTRIVHVPGDNICSFAYALSNAGARKALFDLGLEGQHKPYDNHLSDLCRLRRQEMRCVSVVPSLFVHHKPKGRMDGDSDINGKKLKEGEEPPVREVGFTENIVYSSRLNLGNLVTGRDPVPQW